jgi:membrane-associated HD superfamily phosphohydrolase
MAEVLVIGGFLFWVLILAEISLLFILTECEQGVWATISLAAFVGIMQWGFRADIFAAVLNNWGLCLSLLAAYFVVGAAWSIMKWYLFVKDCFEDYTEAK